MNPRAFQIHLADNVATLLDDAPPGPVLHLGASADSGKLAAREFIARGHKIALTAIAAGAAVVKYGVPIGHATRPIAPGEWVHIQNLTSDYDARSKSLDLHTGAPTDTAYV